MQQERALAGRWRTFERCRRHADDGLALGEAGQDAAQAVRAFHRVELVAAFCQPRRGVEVIADPEGDHEVVAIVGTGIGHHAPRRGVDRRHCLPQQPHARFYELPVRQSHGVERVTPEHDIELGVAEHEGIALVDQRDLDLVAQRFGQDRAQFHAAETSPQHRDSRAHRFSLFSLFRGWMPRGARSGDASYHDQGAIGKL